MQKFLIDGAGKLGLNLSELQAQKLLQYLDVLRQWNKVHNLCADASYQHMVAYHLLDSISIAGSIDSQSKNILDVGTGAGLPGIPLAIVVPCCSVTLLDAKAKKIAFINHIVNILQLKNVVTKTSRIENYTTITKFDLVVSRAFANLTDFVKLSGRLCIDNGVLVAMKSNSEEFILGATICDNYKIIDIKNLTVPGVASKRSLVLVGKK